MTSTKERVTARTIIPRSGSGGDGERPRPWLGWAGAITVAAVVVVGCFAGGDDSAGGLDDDYMDDPPPPGGCDTDCPSPGSDGSPVGGPCVDSNDCATGGVCSATFDGEVQSFLCQDECVSLEDDTQWCADDSSCCTAGAICSPRGYCIMPGDTGGPDSSGDGADSSTGGGATGTGGRGTTDSGGSSSTGPGTGGSGSSGTG